MINLNYEPLDDKVKLILYIDYLKRKDNSKYSMWFTCSGFIKDDVKSAVNGLKKSIKNDLDKARNTSSTDSYFDGYVDALGLCILKINKWFKDVIKGD